MKFGLKYTERTIYIYSYTFLSTSIDYDGRQEGRNTENDFLSLNGFKSECTKHGDLGYIPPDKQNGLFILIEKNSNSHGRGCVPFSI